MLFHGVYILNKDPFIVALWGDDAWEIVANSTPKPEYFLWHNAWFQGTIKRMLKLKYKFYQLQKKGIQPLQITNSSLEDKYRRSFGIPGFQSSSYVYTDENQYPILQKEKKYDAVYAAQLRDFKRIPLASKLEKLYVLTYKSGQKQWSLYDDYPTMKHADFNHQWVDTVQKNQLFSASEIGLCLSQEEGPMLASLEYMLNGLPVVSTQSRGGRDEYYQPDYCKIVDANPEAVRNGVKELIGRQLSAEHIREQTINKLNQDRRNYTTLLSEVVEKRSRILLNPQTLMGKIFTNPKNNFLRLDNYRDYLLKQFTTDSYTK